MELRRYVVNPEEGRLRAPYRLLLAGLYVTVLVGVAGLGLSVALGALPVAVAGPFASVAGLVAVGVATLVAVLAAAVWPDRRTLADLGFGLDRDWWVDFGFGLALGAGLMTGVFLVAYALGWVRVTGTFVARGDFLGRFAAFLLLFVVVGVYEEAVARGYLLTNLAEGLAGRLGERGAVAVATLASALVFGLLHAGNPGASPRSTVAITLAGVMLALGYVLTGDLAIPVGLHVTWNLFQGVVYGFGVSGLDVPVAVVATESTGPALYTGGSFGPEAGLLGVTAVVVGAGAVVRWVEYRYGRVGLAPGLTTPDLRG